MAMLVALRRDSASSYLFWTAAVILATVVLLVDCEECRPLPNSADCDHDLVDLPYQEMSYSACLGRHQVLDGQQEKSDPDQIAQRIVLLAKICLEYIDEFKESFAYHVMSLSWEQANAREPPKFCEPDEGCPEASEVYQHEQYLAVVPSTVPVVPDLNTELLKSYYLLQHYAVALQHLALDQQFLFDDVSYREYVATTAMKMEDLLCRLIIDIEDQGLSPDAVTTEELSKEVYRREWISDLWRSRDFVFLRDTWVGLQYVRDTFTALQASSRLPHHRHQGN